MDDDALLNFAAAAFAYFDEPCSFDHHGYCQTHFLTDPCPMHELRKTDWPERLSSHLARWEADG
jgi:hypothetical protein